jgi:hypothetical protein
LHNKGEVENNFKFIQEFNCFVVKVGTVIIQIIILHDHYDKRHDKVLDVITFFEENILATCHFAICIQSRKKD